MDWYSKTFVLPLLYPTPARHCNFVLILTSQLSASSRELKTSEPSLCYVFAECPTSWCLGPMQNGQVVPYKPDFSDVLPQLVLTTLPHWPPIAVDNLAAKLKASKTYLRAERQLRDGSSTAVGRRTVLHARKTGYEAPSETSKSNGQGSVWTANSKHTCCCGLSPATN